MSRIRADKITNKGANGAPDFPNGITVTGVVTATTMSQNITGNLNVTGNIGVGGTLTYEDVTNVDSVGVITARNGIRIGAGKSIGSDGAAVVYYGDGSNLTGAGPSLANGSNDRVVTATGANALNGEANLTFANSGTDPILTLTNSGSPQLQLSTTGTSDNCAVNFGDSGDSDVGKILYANTGDTMRFSTAGTERLRIGDAGQLGIGGANYGTSGQFLTSGGASAAPSWSNLINQNAVSAPTGASEYIWTSIPSTAREITFTWYNIVPAAGSNNLWVQVGHSGGIQGSGYGTISGYIISGNQSNGAATHWGASSGAKFMIAQDWHATNVKRYGTFVLRKHDTANMWIGTGSYWIHDASDWVRAWGYLNGYVNIANLDRFRVYNSAGANWASGGTFNCYWY